MSKLIYSQDHKQLVSKLKKARLEAKLNQERAADLSGKSQSYISKLESGQRKIDITELKELAKIYKKPINFFH